MLGSVVNHTYTDGKDNDLIHWLPNQLAHNLEKRSTLMQLEAVVSDYVASNEWRYGFSETLEVYQRNYFYHPQIWRGNSFVGICVYICLYVCLNMYVSTYIIDVPIIGQ